MGGRHSSHEVDDEGDAMGADEGWAPTPPPSSRRGSAAVTSEAESTPPERSSGFSGLVDDDRKSSRRGAGRLAREKVDRVQHGGMAWREREANCKVQPLEAVQLHDRIVALPTSDFISLRLTSEYVHEMYGAGKALLVALGGELRHRTAVYNLFAHNCLEFSRMRVAAASLVCSLDELFGVCASMHNWLQLDEEHVVVLMVTQSHSLLRTSSDLGSTGSIDKHRRHNKGSVIADRPPPASIASCARAATDALCFLRFVTGGKWRKLPA